MDERWAWVPGFEDYYRISSEGRVVSYWRVRPRELKQATNRDGYKSVMLCSPNVGRVRIHVHQLVLLAFVGERPNMAVTRHLDGNPQNNTLANLAYGTQSENMQDTLRHGRHRKLSQTECVHGHLFDAENTYERAGHRACRACNRAAVARYKRKALS